MLVANASPYCKKDKIIMKMNVKGGIIIVSIIEEIDINSQWSFIWLMYVNDVDLSKHCKPCLKGYTSKKITKWTRHEENLCLDESEAKYYYLCGGSYPYKWENNIHLAWKEKSGESFEYSFNGITIRLKNAERIEFSQDDIENFIQEVIVFEQMLKHRPFVITGVYNFEGITNTLLS